MPGRSNGACGRCGGKGSRNNQEKGPDSTGCKDSIGEGMNQSMHDCSGESGSRADLCTLVYARILTINR